MMEGFTREQQTSQTGKLYRCWSRRKDSKMSDAVLRSRHILTKISKLQVFQFVIGWKLWHIMTGKKLRRAQGSSESRAYNYTKWFRTT
jgi:hypothetical protein